MQGKEQRRTPFLVAGNASRLILAYHGTEDGVSWPKAISLSVFERQMQTLKNLGYVGLTVADFERKRVAGTLPSRALAVTFDDGYASNLEAFAVLSKLGWPATVFLQLDFVESGQLHPWAGVRPLSWDEIVELGRSGWEIGSHTLTHPRLSKVSDQQLKQELADSRSRIQERLGACETIAYPHGDVDSRVAAAAAAAGYLAGVALDRFHLVDEPTRRPRLALGPEDLGWRLRLKISDAGMKLRESRLVALGFGTGRATLRRI